MPVETDKLTVVHYPDPVLRKKCDLVETFDDELKAIVERMFVIMKESKGVGLAGPQVGIPLQIVTMNPTGEPEDAMALINPVISEMHGNVEAEEGCLSLPGVCVNVRRAKECIVTAQDINGQPFEMEVSGMPARICQHETDHLHGVMIIDRMGPTDKIANRKAIRELDDAYKGS